MKARLRRFLGLLGDQFFLVPGLLVSGGIAGGLGLVALDRSGVVPAWLIATPYVYSGGATGARTLLGAVASSTIGVASTVFSITIAALSLAAGQMGPRLLRNFTRDRGNQVTLGIFLGTFSYALVVLRTIRTHGEGEFVPNVALSVAVLLAILCVATLVFFVGHIAGRINVDTVIDLVSEDVRRGMARLTTADKQPPAPAGAFWRDGTPIADARHGYLQELDADGLADWAAAHGTAVRLLVRPGDYVFPGAPIAVLTRPVEGAATAIGQATAIGRERVSSADLEFAVRQLVEVAVRALSPGINDPHTAMSVLDRLGASLCDLASRHLPHGVWRRDGQLALVVPAVGYGGLVDAMFHMIRQNGSGSAAVLIRLLEVLRAVASCEADPNRVATLQRHADLVLCDAERIIATPADLADIRHRHRAFAIMCREGLGAWIAGPGAEGGAAAISPA